MPVGRPAVALDGGRPHVAVEVDRLEQHVEGFAAGAASRPASCSTGGTPPTRRRCATAATSGPSSRSNASSPTTTRSGWSPSTSVVAVHGAENESSMPRIATSVVTAAPIPSAVSSVRRGVRSTLPIGIRRNALRGHGSRRSSRDEPAAAGAVGRRDGVDRRHAHGAPDRPRRGDSGSTNPRAAPRANGARAGSRSATPAAATCR